MNTALEGLLLGLASGVTCLGYCAPLLLPYLFSEATGARQNALVLLRFLAGRASGYLLFAVGAWGLGSLLEARPAWRDVLLGASIILLAAGLLVYGFRKPPASCLQGTVAGRLPRGRTLFPMLLGLITGLHVCPPMLLAVAAASRSGSLAGTLAFFALFFVGTSVYLLPTPLVGLLPRSSGLRTVGRLAVGVAGVYYLIFGGLMLGRGIAAL
jgi:sulfite exporter TauE/SafE